MVLIGAFCEYVSRLLSSLSMRAFENVVECVNTISLIFNHHFSKSSEQLKNYQENERKIIFGIVGCEENSLPYQTGRTKMAPTRVQGTKGRHYQTSLVIGRGLFHLLLPNFDRNSQFNW